MNIVPTPAGPSRWPLLPTATPVSTNKQGPGKSTRGVGILKLYLSPDPPCTARHGIGDFFIIYSL